MSDSKALRSTLCIVESLGQRARSSLSNGQLDDGEVPSRLDRHGWYTRQHPSTPLAQTAAVSTGFSNSELCPKSEELLEILPSIPESETEVNGVPFATILPQNLPI